MITYNSRIRDIYKNPVGNDLIKKLLMTMNVPTWAVDNWAVGSMKLSTVKKLAAGKLTPGFFDAFIEMMNADELDNGGNECGDIKEEVSSHASDRKWWKEAIFYQIYPRSFYDTNGDGIGDLRGIIEKLDYLKDVGIDALWLSPIYDSPNDDNGYDIRDYRAIMKEFGTMEDFDELLAQVHKRGMRLIMDLVVNHTSDEHMWFKEAVEHPESKYHNYYIWRDIEGNIEGDLKGDIEGNIQGDIKGDIEGDKEPNNWTSFFAGSAWNKYDEIGQWALHLFSKKQMDLNWDNSEVRAEVIDMIKWWLEKGVDGFRMDVINAISKQEGLKDGDPLIGQMMGVTGIEHYIYGPNLHKYLRQIRREAFDPYEAFSVGETPGLGMKMAQKVTGDDRGELDILFSFDHLESPGHTRMEDYEYDLEYLRDYMIDWQTNYGPHCWMSLFYNNHDNPKMASKICRDKKYIVLVQQLLAVMQLTLRGTPFIFQGEEMGLCNYDFTSIDEITDVEAKGFYRQFCEKMSPDEAFRTILAGTREHARILLPWNDTQDRLVRSQSCNEEIRSLYKWLIKFKKGSDALIYGDFAAIRRSKGCFTYSRGGEIIIDINLTRGEIKAYRPSGEYSQVEWPRIGRASDDAGMLAPYEVRIWKR